MKLINKLTNKEAVPPTALPPAANSPPKKTPSKNKGSPNKKTKEQQLEELKIKHPKNFEQIIKSKKKKVKKEIPPFFIIGEMNDRESRHGQKVNT
jgi:hypothetical protein